MTRFITSSMHTLFRSAALLVAVLLITTLSAHAQFSGSVQGTAQDPSSGALPGAAVTLSNVDTSVTQSTTSDSSGVFRFASLAPGNYQISVTALGLPPHRRTSAFRPTRSATSP